MAIYEGYVATDETCDWCGYDAHAVVTYLNEEGYAEGDELLCWADASAVEQDPGRWGAAAVEIEELE